MSPDGRQVKRRAAGMTRPGPPCYPARMARIHILGASGSGATTLGAALADRLGVAHVDSDNLFWLPTDPPFTTRRPADDRLAMLLAALPLDGAWVFSGSSPSWTAPVQPAYQLIVYLYLAPAERMRRLRAREATRYGARIAPGGDMAAASAEFLAWAAAYDTAGLEQRSMAAHEAWLPTQTAPVLRLDAALPVAELLQATLARLP